MLSSLAIKFRLTAEVLGCAGRKDLCGRFRAVNPATQFDVERAHKWLQGKSLPRAASIYDDWAKVLGTDRSGAWLAACTVDAFLTEICTLYDADRVMLMRQMESYQAAAPVAARHNRSPEGYLCGSYACYTMAWSPYYRGHLLRGALLVDPGRRDVGLRVTYAETLLGELTTFRGTAIFSGRTVHFDLRETSGMPPLFMSLIRSGPPVSVLCGVMSGATCVGPQPQPSTTRIAVIRVPDFPGNSNRYLLPSEGAIADDLMAAGLRLDNPSETDALLRNFLVGAPYGFDQITESDQVRIATMLDKSYL